MTRKQTKSRSSKAEELTEIKAKNCIGCGFEIPVAAKYCPKCGSKQPIPEKNESKQNEKVKKPTQQKEIQQSITLQLKKLKNGDLYLDKESEMALACFFKENGIKKQSDGFCYFMQKFFMTQNLSRIESYFKNNHATSSQISQILYKGIVNAYIGKQMIYFNTLSPVKIETLSDGIEKIADEYMQYKHTQKHKKAKSELLGSYISVMSSLFHKD